jgi:LacI family transcriptional regulator, galactose operon repressor
VQHLAALGHVRIAFVSGPPALKAATARRVAFQQCMKEIDLETPLELLVEGDHTMEAGIKAMSALTSLPDPPAAVVCSDDMTAIGVMRQASELGLNIPQDLSVVGFEDSRLTQFIIPPLTSVRISPIEIADFAFRALLDPVESSSERSSPEVNTVKTNLVLRRSTAFPPGRLREVVAGKRQHEHSGLARE